MTSADGGLSVNTTLLILNSDTDEAIFNSDEHLRQASDVCTVLLVIMCLVGIVGNSLSLYIYRQSTFGKSSINILLAALSATDLCLCVLAIPVFSGTNIANMFPGAKKYLRGHILIYSYPVTLMLQSMSVWMLVVITVDRYLAVCHPFKARVYCTSSRAKISIYFIVFFSVAYNFVRFWEFTLKYDDETAPLEESLVFLLRQEPLFMLLYQNIATNISQFFIPLIVLCALNFQVASTILTACEQRKQLVASEKREHNTAKMMLYIVIVFIFCYTLSMILNLIEIFNKTLFQTPFGYLLNDINNILVVLNSSSSFIFYTIYSTRYRAQLLRIWCIRIFVSDSIRFPAKEILPKSNSCPLQHEIAYRDSENDSKSERMHLTVV